MSTLSYGQRQIVTQNQTAQPVYRTVPLTPADFLDPQPGDEFIQGAQHERDLLRLVATLRYHYRYSPLVSVLSGIKLLWPDPQLARPAPDVLLVNDLPEPSRLRTTLDLIAESVTLRAVIEIVSPLFAAQDLEAKRNIYAQAGVNEYWLLDAGLRPDADQLHYTITGLRLDTVHYLPIAPDDTGKLVSPACRLWFQVTDNGQAWAIGDMRTGRTLEPPAEGDDPSRAIETEASLRADTLAARLDFLR